MLSSELNYIDIKILKYLKNGLLRKDIAETMFKTRRAIDKRIEKIKNIAGCNNDFQLGGRIDELIHKASK